MREERRGCNGAQSPAELLLRYRTLILTLNLLRFYSYKPWKASPGRQRKGGSRGSKGPGRQTMPSLLSNPLSQRPQQSQPEPPLASPAAGALGDGLSRLSPGPRHREEEFELEEGEDSGSPFAASAGPLRGPEFSAASPDAGILRHRHHAAAPQEDEGGGLLLKGGGSPRQKHQGPGGHDRRRSSGGGAAAAAAAGAAMRPSSSAEMFHVRNNSIYEAASGSVMSFATLGSGPSVQTSVAMSDDLYAASVASTHISCGCFSAAARLIKRAKIKRKSRRDKLCKDGGGDSGGGRGASLSPFSSGFPSPRGVLPSPIREVQLY